jgi:hypothetical protein
MWIINSDASRLIAFFNPLVKLCNLSWRERECTGGFVASSLVVALRLLPPFAKTSKYSKKKQVHAKLKNSFVHPK